MAQKNIKVIAGVFFLFIYCFAFQGYRGLFEPDEGRYSAVALQMIKSHDWIIPRTHPDHEHWTKPPLTYWAIAGSILTFGKSEFAVRFPNALSFLICIIACFHIGKMFTPKRPWVVALVFGTFLFPATVCNGATTDYPVTMWETLAVCFFAHAYWGKSSNRQHIYSWFMWIFFGLAFLTKGPPGILPLFSIIIFLQLQCSKMRNFNMRWLGGLLIMIIIGGSWYFAVIIRKPELVRYFLWDEMVLRLFTGHHQRHFQWYAFLYIYFPVLALGTLPWSFYAGKGFIKLLKIARDNIRSDFNEGHSKYLFLMLWIFIPLIIFILSKSNLPLYVLPLFVPLAVITAMEIEHSKIPLNNLRYRIALWCVFLVVVRLFMGTLTFRKDSSKFAEKIKNLYPRAVEEIVFANTRQALGLQFYTGADIGRVSFEYSDLKNKFKEARTRLWIVTEPDKDRFHYEMQMHDVDMIELGPIEAWKNYVLFREISDSI